jgi:hypothetical protein
MTRKSGERFGGISTDDPLVEPLIYKNTDLRRRFYEYLAFASVINCGTHSGGAWHAKTVRMVWGTRA